MVKKLTGISPRVLQTLTLPPTYLFTDKSSVPPLTNHLSAYREDKRAIFKAAGEAEKAVSYLLSTAMKNGFQLAGPKDGQSPRGKEIGEGSQ